MRVKYLTVPSSCYADQKFVGSARQWTMFSRCVFPLFFRATSEASKQLMNRLWNIADAIDGRA